MGIGEINLEKFGDKGIYMYAVNTLALIDIKMEDCKERCRKFIYLGLILNGKCTCDMQNNKNNDK